MAPTPPTATSMQSGAAAPVDHAGWFTSEVHPHEPLLRNYLRGNFPGMRDGDDVVQESYVQIWTARADNVDTLLQLLHAEFGLTEERRGASEVLLRRGSASDLWGAGGAGNLAP